MKMQKTADMFVSLEAYQKQPPYPSLKLLKNNNNNKKQRGCGGQSGVVDGRTRWEYRGISGQEFLGKFEQRATACPDIS
jgi:hypothetical protein